MTSYQRSETDALPPPDEPFPDNASYITPESNRELRNHGQFGIVRLQLNIHVHIHIVGRRRPVRLPQPVELAERNEMHRAVLNLIAAAERSEHGFADVPPGSINDQTEIDLAALGYPVALSDRLWVGGYRVHTPESVRAGNYRPYVPPSIFTCTAPAFAHIPDARDFDLEAILEERGEIRSN